jgi:hypothetical protein
MWFLYQRLLLTKDNLAKRNWQGSKNVVITIRMKQYIFLLSALLQRWFGELFIYVFQLITTEKITNLFDNWLAGVNKKERHKSELVLVLFFWHYGMCVMIIFLTELNKNPLCRLSHCPHIGFVCGPSYNKRTSDG